MFSFSLFCRYEGSACALCMYGVRVVCMYVCMEGPKGMPNEGSPNLRCTCTMPWGRVNTRTTVVAAVRCDWRPRQPHLCKRMRGQWRPRQPNPYAVCCCRLNGVRDSLAYVLLCMLVRSDRMCQVGGLRVIFRSGLNPSELRCVSWSAHWLFSRCV